MTEAAAGSAPAPTAEEWRTLDRRVPAREVDAWARAARDAAGNGGSHPCDDATQYVAKLGVTSDDCVLLMSRAHDYVVVPPPERLPLASFALHGQPFGFSAADVLALRRAAETVAATDPTGDRVSAARAADELRRIARRVEMLLPP